MKKISKKSFEPIEREEKDFMESIEMISGSLLTISAWGEKR